MIRNHEIDYRIFGEEMQYVEVELDPGETAVAEPGAFMMMDDGIEMQTIFGDGSQQQDNSLMGKLFSAGKRLLVGENLFMTAYTNTGQGKKHVSFASPYPGKIISLSLLELGGTIICQKDAFLCAAKGVSIGIEFQRKLGTGLFGGGLLTVVTTGLADKPTEKLSCEPFKLKLLNRTDSGLIET